MQARGLTAKVSSIHVNGWFGAYDKLAMTKQLMREAFGDRSRRRAREHYVFVGDSPNDAPMFAYFPHAVGVANIREFAGPARARADVRHYRCQRCGFLLASSAPISLTRQARRIDMIFLTVLARLASSHLL